jgi:transketolase
MKPSIDDLCVNTIRFLSVDAVEKANSGHPGTPMEAAPLGYVLWTRLLKHNPRDPHWPNRDRFVLSAGHASMLLYSLLHLSGYDLPLEELKNFRQWESKTPGHPEHGLTPGVETTTGPLGQGFATGVGMAMAERHLAALFNRPEFPLVDYLTWAFVSDGDLMEGVSSEAASLAGHLRLGKLKYVYLDNRITIEGSTDLAFSEDVGRRFEAYGWRVFRVEDANDLNTVERVFKDAQNETDRPTLIIARTHIGFGSPHKQDTAKAHGEPLGAEETLLTKKNLNWPTEPTFFIPEEVKTAFQAVGEKGAAANGKWETLLADYKKTHPTLAPLWETFQTGRFPEGWAKTLPSFSSGETLATRQASGKMINALAPVLPGLWGGSADLAPSNNTVIERGGDFNAENPSGRNLHFGIREHAMGSILNGIALTAPGLIPYGATFLTFTDYMKPAIRLAALMELGVIYIMTHDSIGLGEDGPTHQPIEHLAALRAIPRVAVIRPADATETAVAWRIAIERRYAPTVIVLTRQKLPVLDRSRFSSAEGTARGAYILSSEKGGKPKLILIATGSEVPLALAVQEKRGPSVRVVSMPSWELFDSQPAPYREEVLPSDVWARVAIEAGCSLGWHKYVGSRGALVTLDHFGASGPGEKVLKEFGFTVENVVQVCDRLKSSALT